MSFSNEFIERVRGSVLPSEIIGKRVALKSHGAQHKGLCPFHSEKTPSFTVNDDKGFYHCFGCEAHGSVFDFLMNTEGLLFREAVERAATIAGIPIPAEKPHNKEKQDQRQRLYECTEEACRWFEAQLRLSVGFTALEYLKKRGLTDETMIAFRLGYAPDTRSSLTNALKAKGFSINEIEEAGLAAKTPNGHADRFHGRVIFPITDEKGRVIAFGGRTLDPEAKEAKYINSPETALFKKGQVLYNRKAAREASFKSKTLIAAEGYMDVIALSQAGFAASVAPLGTSLTQNHLAELWRISQEPVICLDGDQAGKRAMSRIADLAVPELKPGFSLRFAEIPGGDDPDSFIAKHGPEQFSAILSRATPLSDYIFERELAAMKPGTPERMAAFRETLKKKAAEIRDREVSKYYSSYFLDKAFALGRRKPGGKKESAPAFSSRVMLVAGKNAPDMRRKEKLYPVLAALHGLAARFPALLADQAAEEELLNISFVDDELELIRAKIFAPEARENNDFKAIDAEIAAFFSKNCKIGLKYERFMSNWNTLEEARAGWSLLLGEYNNLLTYNEKNSVLSGSAGNELERDYARVSELHRQVKASLQEILANVDLLE